MALLAQTASPYVFNFFPGSAVYGVLVNSVAQLWVAGVIMGGTIAYALPVDPTIRRVKFGPVSAITPTNIWAAQTSWPIGLNIILTFGTLVLPPAASKRVSGVFQDQNSLPIARVGFLYDRGTGAFLGSFNSSGVDGSWDAYAPTVAPTFAVLIPSGADSRNGVMLDNLVPL